MICDRFRQLLAMARGGATPVVAQIPSDVTPNAFSFTAQTGAALSTLTTSNSVTPTGYDTAAPISISGGQYQIGAGSWGSSSGTITPGQSVKVRLTSSSSYSTLASCTLTIGGVSAEFDVTTTPAPSPTPTAGLGYFVIGVFGQRLSQPGYAGGQIGGGSGADGTTVGSETWPAISADSNLHATWKARGINTIVGFDTGGAAHGWPTFADFDASIRANGLKMIRTANPDDLAGDAANPDLVAWQLRDEPEDDHPDSAMAPFIQSQIDALGSYKDSKPLYQNHAGHPLVFPSGYSYPFYKAALDIPDIDIHSTDWYPDQYLDFLLYSGYNNANTTYQYTTTHPGLEIASMKRGNWNPSTGQFETTAATGEPALIHIATGRFNQHPYHPDVNTYTTPAAHLPLYIWSGIINGADGIQEFPQGIGNVWNEPTADDYSRVLTDVRAQLAIEYGRIAQLTHMTEGDVLMDAATGMRRASVIRQSANCTTDPNATTPGGIQAAVGNQLPFGFEGCEITVGSEKFRIVLNLRSATFSLSLTSDALWGTVNMGSFAAYQVKCFRASAPTVDLFA